jgi:hypothetical protein
VWEGGNGFGNPEEKLGGDPDGVAGERTEVELVEAGLVTVEGKAGNPARFCK